MHVSVRAEFDRIALRLLRDLSHYLDHEHGMRTHCRLARQHDRGCAVKDGIRNVRDLRTGRSRACYHRFKHLCGADNHFARLITFADEAFLNSGELFVFDLNAHVSSRDHDSVGIAEDLVKVHHTLDVLDL